MIDSASSGYLCSSTHEREDKISDNNNYSFRLGSTSPVKSESRLKVLFYYFDIREVVPHINSVLCIKTHTFIYKLWRDTAKEDDG